MSNVSCPNCSPKTLHTITGVTVLQNGNSLRWMKFIDGNMSLERAKNYAIYLEKAAWTFCAKEVKCDE